MPSYAELGFFTPWMHWIMECLSTVSYSILFNGHKYGYFSHTRGIRQGDSLSPHLFLFYANGFSHLLPQSEHYNELQGVTYDQPPQVSYNGKFLICQLGAEQKKHLLKLVINESIDFIYA